MAYSTIFFDLDGTLIDPKVGITKAVQYALSKFEIKTELDALVPFIGPPLNKSFQKYYSFDENKAMQAVSYYREYFVPKGLQESTVYDGIRDLLEKLQQNRFSLAIVSSKPTFIIEEVAKYHKLTHYFDKIIGSLIDLSNVDKPSLVKESLEQFDKPKSTVVMIGDREHDSIGAQANGIDSIGVLYGYGSKEEITNIKPTYIVKNVHELTELLMVNHV
ncbi:MAG TPA: HAD hydrolase-like protein [Candidatus Saccharimonadales bacterium]|nr:HAD hydrolase-like protein [Candidatus Saccharimonadales bacterium]